MPDIEFAVALILGWTIAYLTGFFMGRHTK